MNAPHADLFQRFLKEIQLWCRTGKEPRSGDQDMKYYLDLQEKRLQRHNLKIDMRFEPEAEVLFSGQIINSLPFSDGAARFHQSTYFQPQHQSIDYYRADEKIYSSKKYITLYETIINPQPQDHAIGCCTYTCPNCGAISTISTLQEEGCPFCGTRFLMKDLYPKVTNFYCLDNSGISQKQAGNHRKVVWGGGMAFGAVFTVYHLLTSGENTILYALLSFLGATLMSAFLMYIGTSLFYLGRLLKQAGKYTGVIIGSAGSKRKITNTLTRYFPTFSYEYFEGKALSLARTILFHDDPSECVQYKGEDLSGKFSDLIDLQYRGGMGIQSIRQNHDRIEVVLKLYLTSTVDNGKKITEKDETVRLWMYHRAQSPADPCFSIKRVQCPCCGGSFDATQRKTCPYCDQEYDAGINDWVVTAIER